MAADIPINFKEGNANQTLGELRKTLWECSVESILEFHRVVNDLFPRGTKQLRFVVSDFVGRLLNPSWTDRLITYEELLAALSTCETPKASADASSCSILNGLSMAVEALSQQSALQRTASALTQPSMQIPTVSGDWTKRKDVQRWSHVKRSDNIEWPRTCSAPSAEEDGEVREQSAPAIGLDPSSSTKNRGTILVLTNVESEQVYREINEHTLEQIESRNEMIRNLTDDQFLHVDSVNLYVVNVLAKSKKTVAETEKQTNQQWEKSALKSQLVNAEAGQSLLSCMHKILHEVYDLVSTSVSGIPMKEESQGQSVVYDVELIHSRRAYSMLSSIGLLSKKSKLIQPTEHGTYNTVKLNWCTPSPKYKSDHFPLLQNSFLATPAIVNSRPSVCLTTFVLGGKSVMLELDRQVAPQLPCNLNEQKLISHLLCRDAITGGLITQSVAIGSRADLDGSLKDKKPQDVQQGLNYASFSTLMNATMLVPVAEKSARTAPKKPYSLNLEIARQLTSYFPVSLKHTFIYNIQERFEPVLSLIQKPTLTSDEETKCIKALLALVTARDGSDPLTLKPLDCSLLRKPSTKDDQFRVAFEELSKTLLKFAPNSARHQNLFTTLIETSGVDVSDGLPETTLYTKRSATPGAESPRSAGSRSSSPLPKRARRYNAGSVWGPNEVVNLFDFFNKNYQKEHWSRWKDFVGRERGAKLYPNLAVPNAASGPTRRGDTDG